MSEHAHDRPAHDDLEDRAARALRMFRAGLDTVDISHALGVREAEACRLLADGRSGARARARVLAMREPRAGGSER